MCSEALIDGSRFVQIDMNTVNRRREIRNYAKAHGISVTDAIIELVNSGLSHEGRLYL